MANPAPLIDLDAQRRESSYPDGIPVVLGGETYVLPAQFPLEVLDPLLADDLGLIEILRDFFAAADDDTKDDIGAIFDTLVKKPNLPKQIIDAVLECLSILFGEEAFEKFKASPARPGLGDYLFLARSLLSVYGTTLGEAFASPSSSVSGGATPSPTSPAGTPESTSDASGSDPLTRDLAAAGVVEPVWDTPAVAPVPTALPVPEAAPAPTFTPDPTVPVVPVPPPLTKPEPSPAPAPVPTQQG